MQQIPPEQQQMVQQQMMMEMQNRVAEREADLIAEFVVKYEDLLEQTAADPLIDLKRDELKVSEEANRKLGLEQKKLDTNTKVDREKIDQQKDAVAIRSAIAAEKLEKDSINKVMDKAEKITANMEKTTANIMKPNGKIK